MMLKTMHAVLCACYIQGLELLVGQPQVWYQKNSIPTKKKSESSGIRLDWGLPLGPLGYKESSWTPT